MIPSYREINPKKPITPRRNSLVTDVNGLINPLTGDWDVELVKLFWEEDQRFVLALPAIEGEIIFLHAISTNMASSVRSAYKKFVGMLLLEAKIAEKLKLAAD